MQHVIVVGGGIVGLTSAAAVVRAGHRVTILDPATDRSAASWGNAGHIATEQVAPLASIATLRSAYSRRFGAGGALHLPLAAAPTWLPFAARFVAAARPGRFHAGSGALRALLAEALPAWRRAPWCDEGLLRDDGHLVVWESAATADAGRRAWAAADTGTATFDDADAERLARLKTLTSAPIAGAIAFSGSGSVTDPARLADTLEAYIKAGGGRIVREQARLACVGGIAHVIGHVADSVLVAAGVHSKAAMEGIGHRVPMIAERGYHIRGAARGGAADLPPVVFEDRSMIITCYADVLQAASFVELGTPDAPPDPRKWQRLERHVRELGLPMAPPFARWMGSRPTLPDYLPAIGRSRRAGNLVYAFGHQHLGLTLAPITAELVTALIDGTSASIDLAPFDIDRFGGTRTGS